ncbi:hypothetical protein [Pseudomonas sp. X4]|uniref:hypothetical protein n=1 Tax=Pseudomonas sp. X4 TaxID=3231526 RepID=UPI003460D7B3
MTTQKTPPCYAARWSGLPEHVRAALVADAQAIGDVLKCGSMPRRAQPNWRCTKPTLQAARHLVDDLPRIDAAGRVLVLLAPADVWGAGNVESWCNALRPVLLAEATRYCWSSAAARVPGW